jgi:hypothetical protein
VGRHRAGTTKHKCDESPRSRRALNNAITGTGGQAAGGTIKARTSRSPTSCSSTSTCSSSTQVLRCCRRCVNACVGDVSKWDS